MASYVAQTERMVQLAKDRGIEPTAEGLAEATGLSVRVMRGVLAGPPISNRTLDGSPAYPARTDDSPG